MKLRLLAVFATTAALTVGVTTLGAGATATKTIRAHGIVANTGNCSGAEFVINKLEPIVAPTSITVFFSNGSSAIFPLARTGSTAHYLGDLPVGSSVTGAQAVIDTGWSGQFVLGDYVCS
jgi:hypothetical protein